MVMIDLRSDTVTLPSPAMREAMYKAELGDDVFGEDPTVNKLQELAAEKTGHEAALFVTSGTQGNLVCLLTNARRGEAVICTDQAHIYHYEAGGATVVGGLIYKMLPSHRGMFDLVELENAIPAENVHVPRVGVIALENTQNRDGGVALTPDQQQAVIAVARKHNIATHLDGARVFNAAVALGVDVKLLTQPFTSVTFCLSKGLAAPVGSLVCGSKAFIAEARRNRKMLGGGLRQAGVLAAAGLVALTQMVDRLADDHANARLLAEAIAQTTGLSIDLSSVQTDIVVFEITRPDLSPAEFLSRLAKDGIKMSPFPGTTKLRAVTHYGIERADVEKAISAVRRAMAT
jgi:threonine aldolase